MWHDVEKMRFSCRDNWGMKRQTHTHARTHIMSLIAMSLQEWWRKSVSVLHRTYCAILINTTTSVSKQTIHSMAQTLDKVVLLLSTECQATFALNCIHTKQGFVMDGGGVWGSPFYSERVLQQFFFTKRKMATCCTRTCGTLSVHVSLKVKFYVLLNHTVKFRVCPRLFYVNFMCISHCRLSCSNKRPDAEMFSFMWVLFIAYTKQISPSRVAYTFRPLHSK